MWEAGPVSEGDGEFGAGRRAAVEEVGGWGDRRRGDDGVADELVGEGAFLFGAADCTHCRQRLRAWRLRRAAPGDGVEVDS